MKRVNEIPGFENIKNVYFVTREGNVFGTRGQLKPGNAGSYKQVVLYTKDGERKNILVHRLIALAFIPNLEGKSQVNHIDVDPSNNHVTNLEWRTPQENIDYSVSQAIIGTCVKTQKVIRFKSTREAGRNGFRQGHISACLNGKRKTHQGYTWKREDG